MYMQPKDNKYTLNLGWFMLTYLQRSSQTQLKSISTGESGQKYLHQQKKGVHIWS